MKCIFCKQDTESTAIGLDGTLVGPMCSDCEFWCDGNVIHPSGQVANLTDEAIDIAYGLSVSNPRIPIDIATRVGLPVLTVFLALRALAVGGIVIERERGFLKAVKS